MPYMEERCVAGNTIEIIKYHTYALHKKGERRVPKKNSSPEWIKKSNQRRAAKKLRRLLNTNFRDGDFLLTLGFLEKPPDSKAMQDITAKGLRKIRDKCRKAGIDLKYVYVKEIGPKGSRHIHMVCSEIPVRILKEAWQDIGRVHIDILDSKGQYRKIADYFIKYSLKTEETEGQLIGKRWYGSRNLKKPVVKKRRINAYSFRRDAPRIKGYYLEKDSERSGISEFTGYEFYECTFIKAEGG